MVKTINEYIEDYKTDLKLSEKPEKTINQYVGYIQEFLNYTDLHVVDEDKMAIICKGGRFDMSSASGLFRTDLFDSPNKTATSVASYV